MRAPNASIPQEGSDWGRGYTYSTRETIGSVLIIRDWTILNFLPCHRYQLPVQAHDTKPTLIDLQTFEASKEITNVRSHSL